MPQRHPAPNLRRSIVRLKTRVLLGPHFNEGARLLWSVVEKRFNGSIADLAAAVPNLDASAVHLHLHGDRRPENEARATYWALCKVPKGAWDKRPAKPFALPALASFIAKATDVLTQAGGDGVEIGALGAACAFASDPCEADMIAIVVIYLMLDLARVERIPGSARWRLTRAGRAKSAPRKAAA